MANKLGRLEAKGTNVLGVSKPREQINAIRNNQTPGNILGNNLTNDLRLPNSPGRGQFPSRQPENFENVIELGNLLKRDSEKDPYMQLYDAYQAQLQENAASQKAYLEKMYGETADILNKNYDKSANNAYINYRQSQQRLPEQLSNLGITGGASESANLKLQSAYGTNLAENEFSRNNDIASARKDLSQGTNEIDNSLNSQLADAYANFGSQSIAYKESQKEKAEAKAKSESVAKKNNDTYSRMAARQKQGYDVTTWTDEDGIFHYRIVGNSKEETKKKQAEIDKKNNDTQSRMAKRVRQGYDVYTWTDSSGLFHYRLTGKKKLTSSSGGSGGSNRKSGGSSGGGGSSSLPDVTNKGNGGNNKSKPKINYSQAMSYFNQNIAKILGDPDSVVKDLNKKVKSGKMNEITSDYIMTKFPRKKTKGSRKKKG